MSLTGSHINDRRKNLFENITNIKKKFTDETGGKIPYSESIRVKFNALEKFYFFVRRKLESKQKSRKNYWFMTDLSEKKCIPCKGGIPGFEITEIHKYLKMVDGWEVKADESKFIIW